MKKEAYNKVRYYFEAVPEYFGIKEKKKIHYLVFYNGMAGNELVLFKTKKDLTNYKKKLKNKIISENTLTFNLQLIHNEKEKAIYKEHLKKWEELFELIEKDQLTNKEHYHWRYRNYNFNWRTLIIYTKKELEKFKSPNKSIYDIYWHSIDAINMGEEILSEITQIKLVENTIKRIEKIIKEVHYSELETEIIVEEDKNTSLRIAKLEALNQVFNYRHPVTHRHVPWLRGIKVQYNSKKKRYNVNVEVLSKENIRTSYNDAPISPKEHFEKTYDVEDITTKIHYQKLGTIKYPLNQKYIFPFYKSYDIKLYVQKILDDFKDEYNYNQILNAKEFEKYEKRILFVLNQFNETKSKIESVLKAFNPSEFDAKFKDYIYSLVKNEDELWYMPWCRYEYHDHEIVHCFEVHHKFLLNSKKILDKLLNTKNAKSIRLNYSPFDELFTGVDSSFILKMLDNIEVLNDNKLNLEESNYGAFLGIVESLKDFGLIAKDNLLNDVQTFANNFKVRLKSLSVACNISNLYKEKTSNYLLQAGFKNETTKSLNESMPIEFARNRYGRFN